MALPPTIRVKLTPEDAGSISLAPVVVQEMSVRELVEHMLGVLGKDAARVKELLARGSLVSGATRFRWSGWEADEASVRELLDTFPGPDPSLPFSAAQCARAVLRMKRLAVEIPRAIAARHGWFRRANFWDVLMEVAGAEPQYGGYSYKDRADYYLKALSAAELERLRQAADLLVYSNLRQQVRAATFESVELYTAR